MPVAPAEGSAAAGEDAAAAGEEAAAAGEEAAGTITSGTGPDDATSAIEDDAGGSSTSGASGGLAGALDTAAGVAAAGSDDAKTVDMIISVDVGSKSSTELEAATTAGRSIAVEFGNCLLMCRGK